MVQVKSGAESCTIDVVIKPFKTAIVPSGSSQMLIDAHVGGSNIMKLTSGSVNFSTYQKFYDNLMDHRVNCMVWGDIEPQVEVRT